MATNVPQPPTAPAPPPQAPAAPGKKSSKTLVWILAGCGGTLILVVVVLAVFISWGAHKVKGFAEAGKRNPALAAAKIMVAINPDLEIVAEDDNAATLTVRNKKTGEQITMNAEDIKKGRLRFTNKKGEEVTFEGHGEAGKEGFSVKSKEGSMTFGNTSLEGVPSWVPAYPGAKPMVTASKTGAEGIFGSYSFQSSDAAGKVLDYFDAELKGKGFTVERTNVGGAGAGIATLRAQRDEGKRAVNVTAVPVGDVAQVTVQYTTSGGVKE
jgi:hypothetical protein